MSVIDAPNWSSNLQNSEINVGKKALCGDFHLSNKFGLKSDCGSVLILPLFDDHRAIA